MRTDTRSTLAAALRTLRSSSDVNGRLFVPPPASAFRNPDRQYLQNHSTYGEYNYLRPGLLTRVKTIHFEVALELARERFGTDNVIDFGSADGVFLPSLAKHFPGVVAIEQREDFIEVAKDVVQAAAIRNVEVVCNRDLTMQEMKKRLGERSYSTAFLLEVLEHVGDPKDQYPSRIRFLKDIFALLDGPEPTVIISVPTMVGLPFLLQRLALTAFGMAREPIGLTDTLRAGLAKRTERLEADWNGGHLGFNHLRLEHFLRESFEIITRRDIFVQLVYAIREKRSAKGPA